MAIGCEAKDTTVIVKMRLILSGRRKDPLLFEKHTVYATYDFLFFGEVHYTSPLWFTTLFSAD
jgi:hypothetical protein